MAADVKSFQDYLHEVEKKLAAGIATEHSYRSFLIDLIQASGKGITATNEPQHIEAGAPDILVQHGSVNIGYIETKPIGTSLDNAEKSVQVKRYLEARLNLILTDYLEFRWYKDNKCELKARLGTVSDGKIKSDKEKIQKVAELIEQFLIFDAPGVGTPKELAVRMARLAHRIREGAEEALTTNKASDLLSGLYKAFQETLIPGLEVKTFADMYAQTIAYGLFAARCETDKPQDFSRQQAANLIPKTNPFLKDLFYQITGPNLDDEPYKWAVDELVQLLKKADMAEILKDFGKGTGKDDPVVYFYEDFLRAYDKKISKMRGVYYTPIPVVSYIVRSIDYLLKNNFNRPQGLADENTYILDPATGTGTFLYAVINEIYESMVKQGQMGKWDSYVAEHLLTRIFGFELLMAPYVIAHLKLGLQLKNSGYKFQSKERLGVYLTNTLEEAVKSSEMLMAQYIVKEANAAAEVKKEKPIMVVLGNPPYSGISANKSDWIIDLLKNYREVDGKPLGERKVWLQNDYVKFIRFGQWRIENTGQGILAFITDHSYLDSPTFRGMRQSLMKTFTDIYILDLHGDAKRKEQDENVFDIREGVAIAIFIKNPEKANATVIHQADIRGTREEKYNTLLSTAIDSTTWSELCPNSPFYLFEVHEESLLTEYEYGWLVTKIFSGGSTGIQTSRDNVASDFTMDKLKARISEIRDLSKVDQEIISKYDLREKSFWNISEARKALASDKDWETKFITWLYRPFDRRTIFYSSIIVHRTRYDVMHNLLENNLALSIGRAGQVTGSDIWDLLFCSTDIVDLNLFYRGGNVTFPLYIYPIQGQLGLDTERRPNLNPDFIKAFSGKLGLKFKEDGRGDLKETLGPEDVFNYAYAVFHSPTYRTRYAEFLKIDFPRLPLTSNVGLFKALCEKGAELVTWHLLTNPSLPNLYTQIKYDIKGSNIVEKVSYDEKLQRVCINKTQYFEGVAPDVWNFHIGGYQVCDKWLKDRKGRTLSYDDRTHYQKIIVALKETIRLMEEIDELIPGWPVA